LEGWGCCWCGGVVGDLVGAAFGTNEGVFYRIEDGGGDLVYDTLFFVYVLDFFDECFGFFEFFQECGLCFATRRCAAREFAFYFCDIGAKFGKEFRAALDGGVDEGAYGVFDLFFDGVGNDLREYSADFCRCVLFDVVGGEVDTDADDADDEGELYEFSEHGYIIVSFQLLATSCKELRAIS